MCRLQSKTFLIKDIPFRNMNEGRKYRLNNDVLMPVIGQGTYHMTRKVLYDAMLGAFDCGCALLDTAHSYPNEESIGNELAKIFNGGKYLRKDVFITSKIGDRLDNGMPMGYYFYNSSSCPNHDHKAVVRQQVEDSLKKLRTDYIDLLLIHWPYNDCLEDIWMAMEDLYRQGIVRAIGVSNHKVRHLKRIEKVATVQPMVNQMYFSPLNIQPDVYNYCQANNIRLEAYSPLMFLRQGIAPHFCESDGVKAICKKYNKSVAQVVLRWNIDKGVIPIPKASSLEHIKANYDVFDFSLTEEEVRLIDGFNEDYQYLPESMYCPGY